ncbi:hypothetical protein GCM10012275_43490 [Longimycelium tulufanense]|uniref:Uncharacterized protein n=1 Tax=Longimycelium tulufanense TaxID=907463 RepID=A0A8J3FVG9_9PSEU|nr:hypothetical protein GCM10012275_43490 [Longimycelium tulufanense]
MRIVQRYRPGLVAVAVVAITIVAALAITKVGGEGSAGVSPDTTSPPAEWTIYAASIQQVLPGPDPNSVVIQVDLPAGAPGCALDPRVIQLQELDNTIYANVVFSSHAADTAGACPTGGTTRMGPG